MQNFIKRLLILLLYTLCTLYTFTIGWLSVFLLPFALFYWLFTGKSAFNIVDFIFGNIFIPGWAITWIYNKSEEK